MSDKPGNLVGYWASQEQYSMHDLIKFVTEAERGGFNTISILGGMTMGMVILPGYG